MRKKTDNGVSADQPTVADPLAESADNGVDAAAFRIRRRKLTDYLKDPENPNAGSDRGRALIRESLTERGVGAALLADADDMLIGGNQTIDQALAAGFVDALEIDLPPDVLPVLRRADLDLDNPDDLRARQLSLDLNRSRDFAQWAMSVIEAGWAESIDMSDYFDAEEIEAILEQARAEDVVDAAFNNQQSGSNNGLTNDRARQIKAVLYAEGIAIFERALRSTGIENRGAALIAICQSYLDAQGEQDQADAG